MRIAHIADVHLDRPFAGLAGDAGDRARQRLRDTFRGCLEVAAERNVDLITIGGDLWEEENVRLDTRRFVSAALAATGTPVLMQRTKTSAAILQLSELFVRASIVFCLTKSLDTWVEFGRGKIAEPKNDHRG